MEQETTIRLPPHLKFEDLELKREIDSGNIFFEYSIIEQLRLFNHLPESYFDDDEGNIMHVIIGWYDIHRKEGGNKWLDMELLLAEREAFSHYNNTVLIPDKIQ